MTEEPEVLSNDMTALAVMVKAEIDSNVATAKQYPRIIKKFRTEALDMVTLSEQIASDCIFALPRGKEKSGKQKFIEGPSVRFSEIIVSAWGNCRSGSRVIGEEREFVISEGFFHDLEKNVAIKVEVKRRIIDKDGKRYNADMIAVTGNAGGSIARRNAALQGIPKAIWQELYDEAKKTAIGDQKTLIKKRSDMMAYFQKMNVTAETILEFMGLPGIEDIGLDELTILKGIATAIKEGTVSVDNAFKTVDSEPAKRPDLQAQFRDKVAAEKNGASVVDIPAEVTETYTCPACEQVINNGLGHSGSCPEATPPEDVGLFG